MSVPPPSKFYIEDIVRRNELDMLENDHEIAIVLRHWHDSEMTGEDYPPNYLDRPLTHGEIGVSYVATGELEIVQENDFHLVDRALQYGDFVKRSINDLQSGVVVDSKVEVRLEHAVTMEQYGGWVNSADVEPCIDIFPGDYVVYDDWVGQVFEIFEEGIFELTSGELFRFAEIGGRFQVGDRGVEMLPPATIAQLRQSASAEPDLLCAVRPTVLAVSWLAVNQSLPPEVSGNKQRPNRFWTADDVNRLCLVRAQSRLRVSDRVRFKDTQAGARFGVESTVHGKPTSPPGIITVDTLIVRETRTFVKVLWQDGTTTDGIRSTELVPYPNPDEYDCWPGDNVFWKGEDETRAAVVQRVNAIDRTAEICWTPATQNTDAPLRELVPVMELDPHGTFSGNELQPECVGVRRGEFVLIHREGATNGSIVPQVPKIGEVETSLKAGSTQDWRLEMAETGMDYAESHSERWQNDGLKGICSCGEHHGPTQSRMPGAFGDDFAPLHTRLTWSDPKDLDWFGEVIHLRTSGEVEVILPTGQIKVVPLQRLTLLMDGRDTLVAAPWPGGPDGEDMPEDDSMSPEDSHFTLPDGSPIIKSNVPPSMFPMTPQMLGMFAAQALSAHPTSDTMDIDDDEGADDDDWTEEGSGGEDEVDVEMGPAVDEDGARSRVGSPPPPLLEPIGRRSPSAWAPPAPYQHSPSASSGTAHQEVMGTPPMEKLTPAPSPTPPKADSDLEDADENGVWQRFSILSSAPADHAFLEKRTGQPSRMFLTRLGKEYKLLRAGLPDTIIVRAYEDRADLLRSLIIGPENTPYEGAPFVIDWYLDESFPQSPPIAHFHSWTNQNGRVNPNLYEDGKVCLSILGTWAGDKSESWSPLRSSLMQALVSIQGLVLVKEPYFCEPAFEKLRGTPEGSVNSQLYSEKAYVLSCAFVRRAIDTPPLGLEREIESYYLTNGKLGHVVASARALIDKSSASDGESSTTVEEPNAQAWDAKATPRLSAGAILMLQRTLTKLETLLARNSAAVPSGSISSST